jgi:hypothetical protein
MVRYLVAASRENEIGPGPSLSAALRCSSSLLADLSFFTNTRQAGTARSGVLMQA